MNSNELNIELLISAYAQGFFPMAVDQKQIHWYNPDPRAIIPLENYHPSKSLKSILKKGDFEIHLNTSFRKVMEMCSLPRDINDGQWINSEMIDKYCELNKMGLAHSVEVYMDDELSGGLYGVQLGSAFFGESMFYIKPNASKIAFYYLIEILRKNNFSLLDTQFINDNVKRFGAIEISKNAYLSRLEKAITEYQKFSLP